MKITNRFFPSASVLIIAALACQSSTSELTPETASTGEPASTSLPSLPSATDILTAVPVATLAPPLGMFPGKVAFTDTTGHLALLDMLTGEITPLTEGNGVAALGSTPLWSGDGSRFIYGFLNSAINKGGLAIIDVASGERRVILDEFNIQYPSFNYSLSPDGSFLIYDTWQDIGEFNGDDVWRLDVNSGERTLLTANQDHENSDHSALSPDGTRVAYHLNDDIWVMNADGSGKINLAPDEEYYWSEFSPAWSPDSARVAFFRSYLPCDSCTLPDPTENTRGWPPGLWAANADGSGEELIAELPRNEMLAPEGIWLSWSPDGRYLAYLLFDGVETASSQIRIVEVATGEYREIISAQTDFYLPTWSPDSRALMINYYDLEGESPRFTVDIAAVDGSGVWTLFDGTVIWSDPFTGSGIWTLFTPIGGYQAAWSP
jgi:hypothetical protein